MSEGRQTQKLPSIDEKELKEAFDWVMRTFAEHEGNLPSSIRIVAEGKSKNDFSNLTVSKRVF